MKRRGRFVVEAAFLMPGLCVLLCFWVFFTLYAHDYAICAQTALECGTKGLYEDGSGNAQIEERIRQDLKQKLAERVLWATRIHEEVTVDKLRINVVITAEGNGWPARTIEIRQTFLRVCPDNLIRVPKWLKE